MLIQNMLAVDESSLTSMHTNSSMRTSSIEDPVALRAPQRKTVEAPAISTPDIVVKHPEQRTERHTTTTPRETISTAEKILRSFNTWSFKREQPDNLPLMLENISTAIACAEPVSFVLYWGKGPRCTLAGFDLACLDYLAKLADRIRETHKSGAAIKLIFTDTHALLNGHSPKSTQRYFTMIEAEARNRNFDTCYLSQLIGAEKSQSAIAPSHTIVPIDIQQTLSASAKKWFHGEGTAEEAALKYYSMNMGEKRAVEFAFSGSIFITFNGSELRDLFPENLPIFYMYSLRRGTSVKPWFMLEETSSCADPTCGCNLAISASEDLDTL